MHKFVILALVALSLSGCVGLIAGGLAGALELGVAAGAGSAIGETAAKSAIQNYKCRKFVGKAHLKCITH